MFVFMQFQVANVLIKSDKMEICDKVIGFMQICWLGIAGWAGWICGGILWRYSCVSGCVYTPYFIYRH